MTSSTGRTGSAAFSAPGAASRARASTTRTDFDHVRGKKRKNVGAMVNGHNFSVEKIIEEIAKCDVVCSNCHRERTFSRLRLKDKALAS